MESYNGKRRPFRANSSRNFIPKERRSQRSFISKFPKNSPSQSLPLDLLIEILEEEPDDLIFRVIKEMKVFVSMLEDEAIEHKIMARILMILGKASTSRLQSEVNTLISSLSKCKMFYSIHVPQYLASFHQLGLSDEDSQSLEMLTELLIKFHHCMPCTAMEITSVLFPLLENIVKMFLTQHKNLSSLLEKIEEANMRNQEFQQSINPKDVRCKTAKERLQLQKPPENYRTIPIFPTPEDIHQPSPFLRPNLTTGEYVDVEHYLDVQFRLLREDYIKPLRDGISEYLRLKEKNESFASVQDAIVHSNVVIVGIEFDNDKIIHTAYFENKSFAKINWNQSKRLLYGTLLYFSDNDFETFYLATVIERKPEKISRGILFLEFENPTDEVLTFPLSRRFVVIETSAYFEAYKHNLTVLSLLDEKQLPMQPYIIKVKNNVDIPAYLKEDDCFDLRPLFPNISESLCRSYTTHDEFLNLRETYLQFESIHILEDESWPKYSDLNLDPFQLAAIKSALTKEFCIIQGPPGTGKTFVGLKIVKVLLSNKDNWRQFRNCPILVVCYTNHALDQFLEGLLDFTNNIVRIGGSSVNAEMERFNLKMLRKKYGNFKKKRRYNDEYFEEYEYFEENECHEICDKIKQLKGDLIPLKRDINYLENSIESSNYTILDESRLRHVIPIHQFESFIDMRKISKESNNLMYVWLNHGNENQEWKTVGKKSKNSIKDILDGTVALSENEAKKVPNLLLIPLKRRWRLYKLWHNKYLEKERVNLLRSKAFLKSKQEKLRCMELKRDVYLCREADIIGMTTTGAAKNKDLLLELDPKIVVIEEAAEILESHIVTSLSPGTEHVILIGDHQQLRPNPTMHSLAVNYDLNISLFERMIKNGVTYNRLNLQHRMRPEIASLLVPHFYEDLKNAASVEKFENVKGMAKNLFFMTHSHYETSDDSKTKTNFFEAKFIVGLYRYLLLQGYKTSQITILATYVGQMYAIKKELEKISVNIYQGEENESEKLRKNVDLGAEIKLENDNVDEEEEEKGVRVTVVDNYQGEENEIILISFVRSNTEGSIGFLKISNRVCVALSRAKKGFFAVGNFEFLANESDLWKNITEKLKEQDAIGPSLQLKCQNHPDTSEVVTDEEDFNSVSEGGCTRDCEFRLDCGHQCTLKCHPYDKEHNHIKCHKPCNKYCTRGHLCSRECHEDCGDCCSMVDKVVDLCGHETKVFCHRKDKEAACPELCPNFFGSLYNESKVKGVLDNAVFVSIKLSNWSMSSFVEKFRDYLVLQGYEESEVHIMSLSNQESVIKAENKDLVLAVFDNYSDENKFLVASTVTLIALSRLKKGLFCIGDFDSFAEKFDFWKRVVGSLRQNDKIRPTLRLQCQNHIEMCEIISNEKDFYSVKEGGCTKQCEFQLQCGHTCSLKCHLHDIEHREVLCLKPCMKKCAFNHLCTKSCYEDCGCTEIVEKIVESCGHIKNVLCHLQNKSLECSKMCERNLSCGHKCTTWCKEPCESKNCEELITIKLPECGHDCAVPCWMQSLLHQKDFSNSCNEPCEIDLPCGHVCKGTCGNCKQGRLHILCEERCQRDLICGHICPAPCFETCPPCKYPCQEICDHGVCPNLCGEPCNPCTRPCEWKCPHKECNKLCSEMCDRPPCDEPCSVILKCGHPCIGFCGEPCPRKCRICDEDLVRTACAGIDLSNARFISLENCHHFFEVSELTEWMEQDSLDYPIQHKKCPSCNKDILKNLRFGNLIKSYSAGINNVKRITSGDVNCNKKLKLNILGASKNIKISKLNKELAKKCLTTDVSAQELNDMENFVGILLNFDNLFSDDSKNFNFKGKVELKLFDSTINLDLCDKLQAYIEESRKWMTNFTLDNSFRGSMGQIEEFAWEAYRVALADKVMKTLDSIPELTFDASQLVNELMNSLSAIMPFRREDAEKLHSTYEKFLLSSAPECEKMKIPALKSVSSSKGTWFSCQKGHVFSSIRCLETSEVKSCYECDPSIAILPTFTIVSQEIKRKSLLPDTVNRFRLRVQGASSSACKF